MMKLDQFLDELDNEQDFYEFEDAAALKAEALGIEHEAAQIVVMNEMLNKRLEAKRALALAV